MTKEQRARANAKRVAELTAELNAKKKELEELKAWFRVETGEVSTDYGTWLVEFTPRVTPTVDAKRLQTERPEIFAEYGRLSESRPSSPSISQPRRQDNGY